jgi:hypothetical protein
MRLIDMLPPELNTEMGYILTECMEQDPLFDPMSYECQSFALQILLAREVVRQRQIAPVKYEVISSSPYVDWDFEQEMMEYTEEAYVIRDLLSLVDMEVPLEIIETWSDKDISAVAFWAGAAHLKASDNHDVKIPKMPKVLKPYKK